VLNKITLPFSTLYFTTRGIWESVSSRVSYVPVRFVHTEISAFETVSLVNNGLPCVKHKDNLSKDKLLFFISYGYEMSILIFAGINNFDGLVIFLCL